MRKTAATLAAAAALAGAATAQIGTNQPAVPAGAAGLGSTVVGYFTSFNPALDPAFRDNRFTLWTGASSVQGGPQSLVNDVGASYDLWRPAPPAGSSTLTAVGLSLDARNGGVAGTLVSVQGGPQFSVVVHDVKASLYLDGGYYALDAVKSGDKLYGEVGVRVFKAFGLHFFGGVGMGCQFPANRQVFSAFAGATF